MKKGEEIGEGEFNRRFHRSEKGRKSCLVGLLDIRMESARGEVSGCDWCHGNPFPQIRVICAICGYFSFFVVT
jgi:hypothetical protein